MRLEWSDKNAVRVDPYEKLACIYDDIMRHVDYDKWASYINELIIHWNPDTRTVLDIGCGTGNLLKMLRKYSYELYGCDYSLPMLMQAKKKRSIESTPLWRSRMLQIALQEKVDVILCLYDSINYIMDLDLVKEFIDKAEDSLKEKGLLIFDVCTERNSLKYFYNYYDHVDCRTFSYDRWSHYDRKNRIQYTEFKLRFKPKPLTYLETHRQRIYSTRTLVEIIAKTPLNLMKIYDNFTFRPATSQSNRLHFVLQRG